VKFTLCQGIAQELSAKVDFLMEQQKTHAFHAPKIFTALKEKKVFLKVTQYRVPSTVPQKGKPR